MKKLLSNLLLVFISIAFVFTTEKTSYKITSCQQPVVSETSYETEPAAELKEPVFHPLTFLVTSIQ